MKRLLIAVLVICLLLCGCQIVIPNSTKSPPPVPTEEQIIDITEPPIDATSPIQSSTEKVTVYLVEETIYADSGYVKYSYDENCNIKSYTVFTIENDLMYTCFFDNPDVNGMPCNSYIQWSEDDFGENWTLTWFLDGKIKEAQEGSGFSGYQYEYDLKGDITEKRGYYEGMLVDTVYYEYDGSDLCRVYCEDAEGERSYECRVENGFIVAKEFSEAAGDIVYYYEYDENGYLIVENSLIEGENIPIQSHTYKTVEVDADRAMYLLEQQKYLLSII